MKLILALLFAPFAFGQAPAINSDAPKPTPEQQEIVKLRQDLADAQAEIRLYQQGLFQCQAAEIHAQAKAQAQPPRATPKSEEKK